MNRLEKRGRLLSWRAWPLVLAVVLSVSACDLDVLNPNAATEEEVLSDINGVIALAVGMEEIYATNVASYVQAPALVTDEWGTKSLALLAWTSLFTGDNFDDSFTTAEEPWAASYRVIATANNVLASAPDVGLGQSFTSALTALANLYKGMALGQLYLQYQQAPLETDQEDPPAVSRDALLQATLDALEAAQTAWAQADPDELSGFNSRVKNPGFDVGNTINAMLARYYLFAGQWDAAIEAAESVDQTVLSQFDYVGVVENPIYDLSFNASYVAGLQSFVDEAEAGDQRPEFWLDLAAPSPEGNPDSVLVELGQYSTPDDAYPVYLPDEMTLIQAEAYTRLGQFPQARDLINEVRTQTSAAVEEPVAALPELTEAELDTEAELLSQIAYERRYELYMQGLRWEDMRRLDEYIENTYTMQFLPTPEQECLANENISC